MLRIIFCTAVILGVASAGPSHAENSNQNEPTITDGSALGKARLDEKNTKQVPEDQKSDLTGIPALFRTPETGWGGGGAVVYVAPKKVDKRTSGIAGFMYTERAQFMASGWIEYWFADDQWALEAFARKQDYPDYYFGTGRDTQVEQREGYRLDDGTQAVGTRYRVSKALQMGLAARQDSTRIKDIEPKGLIALGTNPRQTEAQSRMLAYTFRWDTLNDGYSPTDGQQLRIEFRQVSSKFGGNCDNINRVINANNFMTIHEGGVVGMQLYGEFMSGDPAWYQLPQLGGKNLLRGYYMGRYRDKNLLAAQTEYRLHLIGKLGSAFFVGAGDVEPEIEKFSMQRMRPSGGFGFRWQLTEAQRINARLDFGFAPKESNPSAYLYIMEAF